MMTKDMQPLVIDACLKVNGCPEEFRFTSYTWLDFMIKVNEFMDNNNWISFPVGEDDEMRDVIKKHKDCEKFV